MCFNHLDNKAYTFFTLKELHIYMYVVCTIYIIYVCSVYYIKIYSILYIYIYIYSCIYISRACSRKLTIVKNKIKIN